MDRKQQIDRLAELAEDVRKLVISDSRIDRELVVLLRPDIYFEAPQCGGEGTVLAIHGPHGDHIFNETVRDPFALVPKITASWDVAKKFMLPNWTIDQHNEWFGMEGGTHIVLTEGYRGATGHWYTKQDSLQVATEGTRDISVLLSAIIQTYILSYRFGKIDFEPRVVGRAEKQEPGELSAGDHS